MQWERENTLMEEYKRSRRAADHRLMQKWKRSASFEGKPTNAGTATNERGHDAIQKGKQATSGFVPSAHACFVW